MRSFCTLVAVVVLSACASTTPDQPAARLQNVVYLVGDDTAPMARPAKPDEAPSADGLQAPSKLMRLYWFLSGR